LIAELLGKYTAAVAAKDAASFMALYDPSVRVFDAWDRFSYEGAAAWLCAVRSWFDSLGEQNVSVTFDDTKTTAAQELAIVSSIVTYTGMSAQGQALQSMANRITWAVRLTDGGARILHEHTSAPVEFGGMTAILKR
jgi:ketosteroid isomerase-like protein